MKEFIDGVEHAGDESLGRGRSFAEHAVESIKAKSREITKDTNGVMAGENGEGVLTKQIENLTARIPSATFLSLAIASVGLSALFQVFGRKDDAQFVGQWVPTILTLGLYNKLVKLEGSE